MSLALADSYSSSQGIRRRIALGAMSGTSLDGIDVAIVEIYGTGLSVTVNLIAHRASPLGDADLTNRLRLAAEQHPMTAGAFAALARDLGVVYANACSEIVNECKLVGQIDLASLHGQTIFHKPPLTLQLINAQPVAQSLKCDVVFDLRASDVFAGGQGAPLTPLADFILFRKKDTRRAVINFGGFCNVTFLPADEHDVNKVSGGDVCACNQILDYCARKVLNEPFDMNGKAAERGTVDDSALSSLKTLLTTAAANKKSLGTGDEIFEWVEEHSSRLIIPEDLLATAAEGIGSFIGGYIRDQTDEAILAGGGTNNVRLVQALTRSSGIKVLTSESIGIPASARESICWAVLGCLAQDGIPVALPAVTHTPLESSAFTHLSGTWILKKELNL